MIKKNKLFGSKTRFLIVFFSLLVIGSFFFIVPVTVFFVENTNTEKTIKTSVLTKDKKDFVSFDILKKNKVSSSIKQPPLNSKSYLQWKSFFSEGRFFKKNENEIYFYENKLYPLLQKLINQKSSSFKPTYEKLFSIFKFFAKKKEYFYTRNFPDSNFLKVGFNLPNDNTKEKDYLQTLFNFVLYSLQNLTNSVRSNKQEEWTEIKKISKEDSLADIFALILGNKKENNFGLVFEKLKEKCNPVVFEKEKEKCNPVVFEEQIKSLVAGDSWAGWGLWLLGVWKNKVRVKVNSFKITPFWPKNFQINYSNLVQFAHRMFKFLYFKMLPDLSAQEQTQLKNLAKGKINLEIIKRIITLYENEKNKKTRAKVVEIFAKYLIGTNNEEDNKKSKNFKMNFFYKKDNKSEINEGSITSKTIPEIFDELEKNKIISVETSEENKENWKEISKYSQLWKYFGSIFKLNIITSILEDSLKPVIKNKFSKILKLFGTIFQFNLENKNQIKSFLNHLENNKIINISIEINKLINSNLKNFYQKFLKETLNLKLPDWNIFKNKIVWFLNLFERKINLKKYLIKDIINFIEINKKNLNSLNNKKILSVNFEKVLTRKTDKNIIIKVVDNFLKKHIFVLQNKIIENKKKELKIVFYENSWKEKNLNKWLLSQITKK